MYLCVDIHTRSCIPVLIFSLGHVYLRFYSHLVLYPCIDILSWSCTFILIFTRGHESLCWYSHLIMYPAGSVLPWWSITMLIFTRDNVLVYYCLYLVMDPLLIFSLGHLSPYWYSHLVMYQHIATLTWTWIALLIFTLFHVSQCS